MEEDENVGGNFTWNFFFRVSIMNGLAALQAISAKPFRNDGILQGVIRKTIALIAIASHTISMAVASSSQFSNSNDLDVIVASNIDSDYLFDSMNKRIYRNVSNNTTIMTSIPHASILNFTGDGDDSGENVTMANIGNNLLATITSTFSAIANDTVTTIITPSNLSSINEINIDTTTSPMIDDQNNYWALSALFLVVGTAAGNILVCLAIAWERRLQNVTNYFLMSLAITDLMVAILVMPLGILSLVKGEYKVIYLCFFFF